MKAIFVAVLMLALGHGGSIFAKEQGVAGSVIIELLDAGSPLAANKAKDEADLRKMREIDRLLRETKIPKVEFRDAAFGEALAFLRQRTGVGFINALAPLANVDEERMSLSLTDIASDEVLRYITQLTHTRYEITPESILIVPTVTSIGMLETREYKVPFDAMMQLVEKAGFSTDGLAGANLFKSPPSLQQCLESFGVTFPAGSAATYSPATGRLIVQTSDDAIELLEVILDEVDGDQKNRRTPLEERQLEKQFRRVLKAKHRLSQKCLRVHVREATMQEIIDGIAEKLPCRLLFVQRDATTLHTPMPGRPTAPSPGGPRLNLSLENVTLLDFLQELARQTGTELVVGPHVLVLTPRSGIQSKHE